MYIALCNSLMVFFWNSALLISKPNIGNYPKPVRSLVFQVTICDHFLWSLRTTPCLPTCPVHRNHLRFSILKILGNFHMSQNPYYTINPLKSWAHTWT
jgi:hypothetical protein